MIAEFSAPIAIIAAGEVMLLICGEIDLSAGNVYAFSAWIFYFAATSWGFPIWLAVIAGLISGSLVGLANGLITVAPPRAVVHHDPRDDLPPERAHAQDLGRVPGGDAGGHTFFRIFGGSPYATSYWALGVIVVMAILLNRTRWGLRTARHRRQPDRGERERRQRQPHQDRQLHPLQHPRRARRHPRGHAAHVDPAAPGRHVDHVLRRCGRRDRRHVAVRRLGHDHRRGARRARARGAEPRVHAAGRQRLHVRPRPRDRDHRLDGVQHQPGAAPPVGRLGRAT